MSAAARQALVALLAARDRDTAIKAASQLVRELVPGYEGRWGAERITSVCDESAWRDD